MKTDVRHGNNGSIEHELRQLVAQSGDGIVTLAPRTAFRILDEMNFPGQRSVSDRRTYAHQHAIITGDWIESYPITFAALPDGRIWLVDGQHRLTAIVRSNSPVPVTLRICDMETERDARKFYAGFDSKDSVRTNVQILDSLDLAAEMGLSKRMTRALYEAAPILANDMESITGSSNVAKSPENFIQSQRVKMVAEYVKQAIEYDSITRSAGKFLYPRLRTTGPVAVAMYTLKHQPDRAREFWTGVAKNDGLRRGDPRHTLIEDFNTRDYGRGSVRQKVQQSALAWNAFYEGRDLKIIKCIVGAAITIAGTPINSKARRPGAA